MSCLFRSVALIGREGKADNRGMDREKGLFGLIGFKNVHFAVDGWELCRPTHTAIVFCEEKKFLAAYKLTDQTIATVVGQEWQIRCDNEDRLFYGYARCTGLSRPAKAPASPEGFPNDLVLHCEFQDRSYGPYHVVEAQAMARNGNSLFFDMLPLSEIDQRIAVGDVRFKYKSAFHA